MQKIKTNIIPSKPIFLGEKTNLDYKAICVYTALGFFLEDDTFFESQKALLPAHNYVLDENKIASKEAYFKWNYNPIERSFDKVVDEFSQLFETIIQDQVQDKRVILPLSGGLDSRTQAVALHHLKKDVTSYSYSFQNGLNESDYGKKIAKTCDFPFSDLTIPNGYLWNKIEKIAELNGCYSEFTHPRQMAVVEELAKMGDVFSLGHWGDVLFDDMGVPDDASFESQLDVLYKKVIKKGGLDIANQLWQSWNLEGNFEDYLRERLSALLRKIDIPDSANAQIRAFKSMYWAPRWTSTNLSVFESVKPITLPYYDNRMCEFICSVPEKYLAGRQIQIEYIKRRNPKVAKIEWQQHRPFNLYNYHLNKVPYNLPYRVYGKLSRTINPKKFIQRNWELQFLGKQNKQHLEEYLFQNKKLNEIIPNKVVKDIYSKFQKENSVYYSHPLSMLLTLSLFFKNNYE